MCHLRWKEVKKEEIRGESGRENFEFITSKTET